MTPYADEADVRQADELEALLVAHVAGHTPTEPPTLPAAIVGFTTHLLDEVAAVQSDASYADGLEARLLAAHPYARPGSRNGVARSRRAPDLWRRASLAQRWLAVAAAVLLLLSLLLAAPQVRAGVAHFFHLGAVTILPSESPSSRGPTPTLVASVLDLDGETSLRDARSKVNFPVRLPSYPADLGQPQYVFAQDLLGNAVVLVWTEPGHPDRVRLSLHELSSDVSIQKFAPVTVQVTSVHGQRALWTDGPYVVQVKSANGPVWETRRLVATGHVLIWTEGGVTYRLETSLSLPEAIRIAESLR